MLRRMVSEKQSNDIFRVNLSKINRKVHYDILALVLRKEKNQKVGK